MKKNLISFALFFSAVTLSAQQAETKMLLNFDDKTVRMCFNEPNDNFFVIFSAWDGELLNIVPDPENSSNNAIEWTKNPSGQLYGGFCFLVRNFSNEGFEIKGWDHFSYRIRGSKPFTSILIKFLDSSHAVVFESFKTLDASADTWLDVKHTINKESWQFDNPIFIEILPGAGEDNNQSFIIDDIRLER